MTNEISIKPGLISDHGWIFTTTVGGQRHTVDCSQVYWKKMTHGNISPMDLVRLGLEMAISRHVTDTLPESFRLEEMGARIDNFEKMIRRAAQAEAAGNPR